MPVLEVLDVVQQWFHVFLHYPSHFPIYLFHFLWNSQKMGGGGSGVFLAQHQTAAITSSTFNCSSHERARPCCFFVCFFSFLFSCSSLAVLMGRCCTSFLEDIRISLAGITVWWKRCLCYIEFSFRRGLSLISLPSHQRDWEIKGGCQSLN